MKLILKWLKCLFKKPRAPHYLLVDGMPYDVSTPEGARAYEQACDESCDIHKIVYRVRKHVTDENLKMTSLGIAMCNMYSHTLKELYDFANRLEDPKESKALKELLLKQEPFVGIFVKWITPRRGRIGRE